MIDFEKLLGILHDGGVRFVIVGHTRFRAADERRRHRLRAQRRQHPASCRDTKPLQPYLRGAPPGLPFVFDEKTIRSGLNFTFTTSAGPLDLLGEMTGVGGYAALEGKTVDVTLFGRSYRCVDLETLIKAKRAAGRPKDFEVIAELETIRDSVD